ncbi:hypothetical protein [Clostridium botulinum]|uniref:hypothetical protein n=1 Tax=Clostridium botulinum TaxID=1491 RepID=UPI00388E9A43
MNKADEGKYLLSRHRPVEMIELAVTKYFISNERVCKDLSGILEYGSKSYHRNTQHKDLGDLTYLMDYIRRYRFESNIIGQLITMYNAMRSKGDLIECFEIGCRRYPPENKKQFTHLAQYKIGKYILSLFQMTPSELREYLTTTETINNTPLKGYDFIPNGGKYYDFYERNLSPQSMNITDIMDDVFS